MKITKNAIVTIDTDIARKMLEVAGFTNLKNKTDEEIFKMALSRNKTYGVNTEFTDNVEACVSFLKDHGYEVTFKDNANVNKWAAFERKGMDQVLHGKIISDLGNYYCVKCKNGLKRYPSKNEIIKIFESKYECYLFTKQN